MSEHRRFARLLREIRSCDACVAHLPHGVRPVLQAQAGAVLRIIGQAPGRKVHESGVPWDDRSGERLRSWLGLDSETFYDAAKVALIPMGFCYPGKAKSGDLPPRRECAPRWHAPLNAQLPGIRLTLLVGSYAQAEYLGYRQKKTLGDTVRAWREYLPLGYLPIVHPSPRNQIWLKKNPWFEAELVPVLRESVRAAFA
ncbi:MAG TPA: uracil-DNA glycosylase family protein [Patescibacteria group bacterium]|nr:uracil-DNA glycosylase family protein [Patescibacteria group bacterium]